MPDNIKTALLKYKRVIIFAVIGGINTAVDFIVFTALSGLTPLKVEFCQAFGYTAGIVCSYILNQRITFKDAEKGNTLNKILRFIVVNAVSLAVGMYGIKLLVAMSMNRYIAKVIITLVTMAVNYVGYKLFVFRVKER
jgi:putative flippase GtrA